MREIHEPLLAWSIQNKIAIIVLHDKPESMNAPMQIKSNLVLALIRGSVSKSELEFPAVYIFTEGLLTGILFTEYHANLPSSGPGSKLYPWPQSFWLSGMGFQWSVDFNPDYVQNLPTCEVLCVQWMPGSWVYVADMW